MTKENSCNQDSKNPILHLNICFVQCCILEGSKGSCVDMWRGR